MLGIVAIHTSPTATIEVPVSSSTRVPVRWAIRGAALDSGISNAAIGNRPAAARRAV